MMRPTCGQAHTGAVLPAEASHGWGAVGKTEPEAGDRGPAALRTAGGARSVGAYLRIGRHIRWGRSFDLKIITMMRFDWEQTARRPRITRRWWAPPGTQH
jgi:hypothetical protein